MIRASHADSSEFGGSMSNPGIFRKWPERPADITFLIDAIGTLEQQVPGLAGKPNARVIGVGGHSFGAHTAQLVGGVSTVDPMQGGQRGSHADPRPIAFLLLSPQGVGGVLDERSFATLTRPHMTITGSNDPGRGGKSPEWRIEPFQKSPAKSKYLVFIDKAHHNFGGMYGDRKEGKGVGPVNKAHLTYVQSSSTAFWDAFLKRDNEAVLALVTGELARLSKGEAVLRTR